MLKGTDPNAHKKEERASKTAFRLLAEEYLEKLRREGRAGQTLRKIPWLMDMANASIGDKPIREIAAPMVLKALRVLEGREPYESARRMRSTIGAVFRYAMATARAETDPTIAHRDALIRPQLPPAPPPLLNPLK